MPIHTLLPPPKPSTGFPMPTLPPVPPPKPSTGSPTQTFTPVPPPNPSTGSTTTAPTPLPPPKPSTGSTGREARCAPRWRCGACGLRAGSTCSRLPAVAVRMRGLGRFAPCGLPVSPFESTRTAPRPHHSPPQPTRSAGASRPPPRPSRAEADRRSRLLPAVDARMPRRPVNLLVD